MPDLSVVTKAKDLSTYIFTVTQKSPKKFHDDVIRNIVHMDDIKISSMWTIPKIPGTLYHFINLISIRAIAATFFIANDTSVHIFLYGGENMVFEKM